jgi:hypothetical protein
MGITNKREHLRAVDLDGVSEPVVLALALGRFGLGAGAASLSGSVRLDEEAFEPPEDSACTGGTGICEYSGLYCLKNGETLRSSCVGGRDVPLAANRTETLSVVCHTVGKVKFKD